MTLRQQFKGEFDSWRSARHRCTNPRSQAWKNYGGRGIRMCERWANSFEAFLEDVGNRPSSSHSIDRINNDGHYEPGNVRWTTRAEQGRNTRSVTDRQTVNCIKLLLRQGVKRAVIMRSLGIARGVVDRIIAGQTWTNAALVEEMRR